MSKPFDKKPKWAVQEKGRQHLRAKKDPEELDPELRKTVYSWLWHESKAKYDHDHKIIADVEACRGVLVKQHGNHWADAPERCVIDAFRAEIEWWKNNERVFIARAQRDEAKYLSLQLQMINNQVCRQIIEAQNNIGHFMNNPEDIRVKERIIEQMGPATAQAQRYLQRKLVE